MDQLATEIAAFTRSKSEEVLLAHRRAAVRLLCGVDLPEPGENDPARLGATLSRIRRAIRRERIKAGRAHWSYDLNRHIALKQALDALGVSLNERETKEARLEEARTKNGARRRRRPIV